MNKHGRGSIESILGNPLLKIERNYKICQEFTFKNKSIKDLAEKYGVSTARAREIISRIDRITYLYKEYKKKKKREKEIEKKEREKMKYCLCKKCKSYSGCTILEIFNKLGGYLNKHDNG